MKREDFLQHVAWTGTGLVWTLSSAGTMTAVASAADARAFSFVQISDSHIGFHQAPNEDVGATLQKAITAINAMPTQPAFVMHTGDITHLSKADQFDTAKQLLSTIKAPLITIPGEHDMLGDSGKGYFAAFQRSGQKDPWWSWDQNGVHFIALVNVFNFEKNGLLGQQQIDWLAKDVASVKSSTPVVVFSHVPLYTVSTDFGWFTEDSAKALAVLAKFDSVTALNGHIHQVMEHVEGKTHFYTAQSTAYPQPAPGTAPGPGPLKVPADKLLSTIGYRNITLDVRGRTAKVQDQNFA
ncbi:MAG TPA: metallophosphoesterase [Candidatus Binatia bacterium]|nr:metallophosphoesterase [Candidatus Binatia bacterium]